MAKPAPDQDCEEDERFEPSFWIGQEDRRDDVDQRERRPSVEDDAGSPRPHGDVRTVVSPERVEEIADRDEEGDSQDQEDDAERQLELERRDRDGDRDENEEAACRSPVRHQTPVV